MSNINKQALREVAKQCSAQEPLRIVEYHGKMCLRNSGGIVFTVLRDSSFPEYSSENENYARLAELSTPGTMLALLDELEAADALNKHLELAIRKAEGCSEALRRRAEAAEKRIAELEEALKQSVSGYKSCLRTGHERIIELGGDCDAPEMMIARNPDIQQAEKVLSAGIITKVGE